MRILSRFSPNPVVAARARIAAQASDGRSKATRSGGWVLALPVAAGILLAPLSGALAQPGPPVPAPAAPAPAAPPPAAPSAQPAAPPAVPAPAPPSRADEPLLPVAPPPSAVPAPLPPPPTAQAPSSPAITVDPDRDAKVLGRQGTERPIANGDVGVHPGEVYAEDWWSQARPVFEIHGYYRVRSELFYNFALGRVDNPSIGLWPQPADNSYTDSSGKPHTVTLCGPTTTTASQLQACHNNTQAGANMRFRINPELHISDNLRILSQIDLLDNLVLGSTPDGYANVPAGGTSGSPAGYAVVARGGYSPLGVFSTTQLTPVAGVNSPNNSISVKRVWGEYQTPVGLLRFGRMPNHWGLGMLANSGDGYDSDYGDTTDRIMFVTGIKKYGLYVAGAWDFVNGGPTNATASQAQGQSTYDAQLNNVNEWVLVVVRREDPELQKLDLAHGKVVINGGMYFVYRNQFLASDDQSQGANLYAPPEEVASGLSRRGAAAGIPDLWLQFLYKKFRFEAEGAMIYGSIDNTTSTGAGGSPMGNLGNYLNGADQSNPGWQVREFGVATQSQFKAIEDKLNIQFGFGWASGDPNQKTLAPAGTDGLSAPVTASRTFSEFAFNPDYRVDMIFYRNILSRVEGSYYFRPSVDYDFLRDQNGQRLGGGAAVIWSRASEFIQAPGHQRDLGLELNFQIYFQSRDGTLNDDPDKMGGFYTALQYGVLFPLGGLGYLPGEVTELEAKGVPNPSTATAQILRWYLGILF